MNTDQIAAEARFDIASIVSTIARPQIDERVTSIIKSAIEKAIQAERERADHNADVADSIARASKQTEDALRQQIFELLAVIHGDGGHYQSEHGTEKATEDAIIKVNLALMATEQWEKAYHEMLLERDSLARQQDSAAHASEQDDTKLAQELTDLAYRVIIEHSGECEVENLPNEMQCRLDAAMRKETK